MRLQEFTIYLNSGATFRFYDVVMEGRFIDTTGDSLDFFYTSEGDGLVKQAVFFTDDITGYSFRLDYEDDS